jgi:hypothetical protein
MALPSWMVMESGEVLRIHSVVEGETGEGERRVGAYFSLYTERSLHDEFLLAYLGLSITTALFTLVIEDVLALVLPSIWRLISLSMRMNCVKAVK